MKRNGGGDVKRGSRRVAPRIMAGEPAQARPSRSQRCYRGWEPGSDPQCDAGSTSTPRQSDLGDPLASGRTERKRSDNDDSARRAGRKKNRVS